MYISFHPDFCWIIWVRRQTGVAFSLADGDLWFDKLPGAFWKTQWHSVCIKILEHVARFKFFNQCETHSTNWSFTSQKEMKSKECTTRVVGGTVPCKSILGVGFPWRKPYPQLKMRSSILDFRYLKCLGIFQHVFHSRESIDIIHPRSLTASLPLKNG